MHLEVDIYKKLSEFDLDVHFKIDEICLGRQFGQPIELI